MKLTRLTPSFDLSRVPDFDQWLRHPFAGFPAVGQLFGEILPGVASRLAADVFEDPDNYIARFELPGVKKDDVKVEVHDRLLTVSAGRREKTAEQQEESFNLTRSITVPEGVRSEAIGAKLEDGILTVTLPKQEQRKPKVIQVS